MQCGVLRWRCAPEEVWEGAEQEAEGGGGVLREVKTFGFDQFPSLVKTGFWKAGAGYEWVVPQKISIGAVLPPT